MTVVGVSRILVFFGAGGGGIRSSSLVEVEDLVIWLDEVIGRPSSTTENPSNFWWHITIYIYIYCDVPPKFEGFSIVDDGLPITSFSQTTRSSTIIKSDVRPHPRPHRNE